MRCTANTRTESQDRKRHYDMRCERELGHPGLHRFTPEDMPHYVQEFDDSQAWYPRYLKNGRKT